RPRTARGGAAVGRDRFPGAELPDRRGGAGVRRRCSRGARREHRCEPALRPGARREALAGDGRPGRSAAVRRDLGRATRTPLPSVRPVKVLIVTMYFPPAGGGGVQRPLKFATHLPELGIETHVLA